MGKHSTAIEPVTPVIAEFLETETEVVEKERAASPSPHSDIESVRQSKRKRHESNLDTEAQELEIDLNAAEPPSKKALRKAKKAEAKNSQRSGEGTLSKTTGKANGGASEDEVQDILASNDEERAKDASTKRSQWGIWIGNLPWTISKIDLREYFTEHSEITSSDITRIHMPTPPERSQQNTAPGRPKSQNRGFAYVDFVSEDAMKQAIGLSERLFHGRRILVKKSDNFNGRPDPSKNADNPIDGVASAGKPTSQRIFVGNLSFDMTKEDLEKHYKQCGPIEHLHMATFEDSGKCKGFAWVTFTELDSARAAVRGWVEKKPEGTAHNSEDLSDDSAEQGERLGVEAEGQEEKKRASKKKHAKPRKWWVNQIYGRPLRVEFAEDSTTRYKKRFSAKDAVQDEGNEKIDIEAAAVALPDESAKAPRRTARVRRDPRTIKPGAALAAAPRVSGSIVESQGQKTVFAH